MPAVKASASGRCHELVAADGTDSAEPDAAEPDAAESDAVALSSAGPAGAAALSSTEPALSADDGRVTPSAPPLDCESGCELGGSAIGLMMTESSAGVLSIHATAAGAARSNATSSQPVAGSIIAITCSCSSFSLLERASLALRGAAGPQRPALALLHLVL